MMTMGIFDRLLSKIEGPSDDGHGNMGELQLPIGSACFLIRCTGEVQLTCREYGKVDRRIRRATGENKVRKNWDVR